MNTDKERKATPIFAGVLQYFPDAIKAVAQCSQAGNDQHYGKDEPLHWNKDVSNDNVGSLTRHLMDVGTLDTDGVRHSAKVAWRALALLQIEIENEAKPLSHHMPLSKLNSMFGIQDEI